MDLREHQRDAVQLFRNSVKGILVYHVVGSGKTLTGISCARAYPRRKSYYITPAAVIPQYKRYLNPSEKKNIYSYEKFSDMVKEKKVPNDCILVLDEAHRLRNSNGIIARNILNFAKTKAFKTVFLSGTPMYNFPWDISPIINVLNTHVPQNRIPHMKNAFKAMFYEQQRDAPYGFRVKNANVFKRATFRVVSKYTNINLDEYPLVFRETRQVIMHEEQERLHRAVQNKTLQQANLNSLRNQTYDAVNSVKGINYFLAQTRQLSNVIKGQPNVVYPKIKAIYDEIKQYNKYPVIVYSNFLQAGIYPLAKYIATKGELAYETLDGQMSAAAKQNLVDDYNSGEIQILLVSSAGSEGLDFRNTRAIHIMEPHFNDTKIQQVIGRGVRYRSHESLDEDERTIKIYRWVAKLRSNSLSADQLLVMMSDKKEAVINAFSNLIGQEPT